VIPYHDSVRAHVFPAVNVALILINIAVFIYEVALSQQVISGSVTELDRFIFRWGNIPACTLDSLGIEADVTRRSIMLCGDQPQPIATIFSAMFMHGGWLHLLGNMLFLWIFGDNVEDAMGHVLYAVFYLLAGAIAAFSHMLIDVDSLTPAVGASGAIAGVMGAYIVLFPRATVQVLVPFFFFIPLLLPAVALIGIWFVMQLFSGFSSLGVDAVGSEGGVAYFAHIGGFVAGLLLVNILAINRKRARSRIGTR
jgi:membrane associated rhomboid family serine protease